MFLLFSSPFDLVTDNQGDSLIFGSRSDEEFKKYEKFLEFLVSCPSEDNKRALNLPDLMGLQELNTQWCRGPLSTSHIFPSCEFDAHEPIMDFIGELIRSSKITVLPDGQIFSTETGTKIKDLLSVVAEFYLSKNSLSWSKQSILVPNYDRYIFLFLISSVKICYCFCTAPINYFVWQKWQVNHSLTVLKF